MIDAGQNTPLLHIAVQTPPNATAGSEPRGELEPRAVEGIATRESEGEITQSANRYGPDAVVSLSPEAKAAAKEHQADHSWPGNDDSKRNNPDRSEVTRSESNEMVQGKTADGLTMSEEEAKEIEKLKEQDREVHAHEQAHKSAGGQYVTGGPQYEYRTGPDGKRYAVGGSVSIDTSPVKGDPDATIRKMQTVQRAALAPANPSAQDRRVAAVAARQMQQAMQQKLKETSQSNTDNTTEKIENDAETQDDGNVETRHTTDKHNDVVVTGLETGHDNAGGVHTRHHTNHKGTTYTANGDKATQGIKNAAMVEMDASVITHELSPAQNDSGFTNAPDETTAENKQSDMIDTFIGSTTSRLDIVA